MMNQLSATTGRKHLLPARLSGSDLKWIAIVTMLIDHIGAVILEKGVILSYNQQLSTALSYDTSVFFSHMDRMIRQIGRISFPIFCFLLVEGFFHTSNKAKYALRLSLFALLSEIPFDLCFNGAILEFSYQNVMVTLLLGFLTIWAMDTARQYHPALFLLPAAAGILAGYLCHADYNWKGIILILILYLLYNYPLERTITACISLLWEPAACFAFLPLNMYNHKKGQSIKYFFYLFYPVHLLLLFLIRYLIFGI